MIRFKVFLLSFFLLSILNCHSQSLQIEKEQFSFVNYSENKIQFFSEEGNLNAFYNQLDSLIRYKKGKVKILQIGGSHIQAEIWPDVIRNHFIETTGLNGGRGFVFPFKIAKTWNPKNSQISCSGDWNAYRCSHKKHQSKWGISGYTVETNDSIASLQIGYRHDSITNYSFNKIKVFYNIEESDYDINLLSNSYIKKFENKEFGYLEFDLKEKTDSLSIEFIKTKSTSKSLQFYGLSLENDDPGIVYTSIGVNGATTKSYLRNELFEKQLKSINPDLVIFCIGINDALYPGFCETCYEENYEKLISKFKEVNPNVSFLFVTNNDSYFKKKYANTRVYQARSVMQKLAKNHNAGLWDLFEVMGGINSVIQWEKAGYAKKDKIHFTKKGYKLLGDLMFEALMKEYTNYKDLTN